MFTLKDASLSFYYITFVNILQFFAHLIVAVLTDSIGNTHLMFYNSTDE